MSRVDDTYRGRFRRSLNVTRETAEALIEGHSVLLFGPRHFAAEQIALETLKSVFGDVLGGRVVRLSAARVGSAGALDFEAVSMEVRRQLGIQSRRKCHSADDFVEQTRAYFATCRHPLTVFLLRGG